MVHPAAPSVGLGPARPVHDAERAGLLDWLDDGLRRGLRGRLRAEYPVSLAPGDARAHQAVFADGAPVSHAMLHVAVCRAGRRALRVGLIGLVYTEPAFRGRGLAGACVEACVRELAARRVPLAALWSDRHDFYRRLGFLPGGRERLFVLDAGQCRRARGDAPSLPTGPARAGEIAALETLYATQPVHAERARGALAALAAAPETRLQVARREGRPVAYAALGRGDDFAGVVHEWAGSPDGVLSCLEALCGDRDRIGWLAGPDGGACAAALRAAGAPVHEGCFALLRIVDAAGLVQALVPAGEGGSGLEEGPDGGLRLAAEGGRVPLAPDEALSWLFGEGPPPGIAQGLDPRVAGRLREALPFPLYLWGFDSI